MAIKKRCLYFDSLFPKGHRKYNYSMVKLISQQYDMDIINYNHYYDELELPSNCNIIDFEGEKEIVQSGIIGRYRSYRLLKKCKKIYKKGNYDFLIIASFDIYVMFLGNNLFSKKDNILIIHHNTIDQMNESNIKMKCFNTYKNKYKHIVLEDYIADYFKNCNAITKNNLFVVYQPLTSKTCKIDKKEYKYAAASLSNSIDEEFLREIIKQEEKNKELEKNNLQIIIKSNNLESNSNNITIIRGFISDEDYETIELESEYILLFYPKSFLYRASDILKNALSNRKKIICSEFLLAKSYAKLYPNTCIIASSYEELVNELLMHRKPSEEEFDNFSKNRSDAVILSQIMNCVGD